jgi:hypothetical protein
MSDFMSQCVERYCELAKFERSKLKKANTPFLDEKLITEEIYSTDTEIRGELQPIASKVLMTILYAARTARYDLLRATCALACRVTSWSKVCDNMLHRLCYINQYPDICMYSVVGDTLDKVQLVAFTDADFAGDPETLRSTSGVFLCLVGPNTFCPLSAVSKKQSCVSHSTPEAEIEALDLAVRSEGIPAILLWEALTQKRICPGNGGQYRICSCH